MLERTRSLTIIQRKADQGIAAAEKLQRNGELVRFSTQRSTLMELDEVEVWRSEINARMALKDYNAAVTLAQSSVSQLGRLQLLALIAKEKIKQGENVEPELVDQITQLASRSMIHQQRLDKSSGASIESRHGVTIHKGERDKALEFLREWFQNEVEDYLIICDPYFTPTDLEALQLLWSVKPRCTVRILTSKEGCVQVQQPYETAFRNYWRLQLSGTSVPRTLIVIAGIEPNGKAPVHDRWWLTKRSGLASGTSYSAWGGDKTFSIEYITPAGTADKEATVEPYLLMQETECGGKEILYSSFTL